MTNQYKDRYVSRIRDARSEAKRFIAKADAALKALESEYVSGGKDTTACKRASMDLSRALTLVRKGIYGE